jgi:[ribosomal protein S18]-alanine N-acetyltransferase
MLPSNGNGPDGSLNLPGFEGEIMDHTWLAAHPAIRLATASDLDRIMEIEALCFDDRWTPTQFSASLKDLFLVFIEANEIIGFLIACTCEIGRRAIIMRIAVHPDYRHRGIASQLLSAALDDFRQRNLQCVELDVEIVKNGAIKLYEKFGFQVMRVATVDYDEDTSFLIMKLILRQSNN